MITDGRGAHANPKNKLEGAGHAKPGVSNSGSHDPSEKMSPVIAAPDAKDTLKAVFALIMADSAAEASCALEANLDIETIDGLKEATSADKEAAKKVFAVVVAKNDSLIESIFLIHVELIIVEFLIVELLIEVIKVIEEM